MICGALQTLNEEAFEDVASTGGGGVAPGETLSQQLAPIREGSEFSASLDSGLVVNNNNNHNVFIGESEAIGGRIRNNITRDGRDDCSSQHALNIVELLDDGGGGGGVGDRTNSNINREQGQDNSTWSQDSTVIVMSQYTQQNMDDTSV